MSAIADTELDALLAALKPACEVTGGKVSSDLDARLHRLFTLSYEIHQQRYTSKLRVCVLPGIWR